MGMLISAMAAAAAPATQPGPRAAGEQQAVTDQPIVMVFPFHAAGEQAVGWVPAAIQQNLVAELSRGARLRPAPVQVPEGRPVDANAAGWAKEQGASYVVVGSYQLVGDELRVTGQVIDARDGDVLGALKATAALRELFGIEDVLSAQALRLLAPPRSAPAATGPAEPVREPVAVRASGPVQAPPPTLQAQFQGSALQRALGDPRSYAATYGNAFEPQRNQYRYYSSPLYPYYLGGYGYGGYGYGGFGYTVPYSTVYVYPGTIYRGGMR
jgi:TolB-like protein